MAERRSPEVAPRGVNLARFCGQTGGFYESYFLRANHPSRPLAFWIRYTLFCPRHAPEQTIGELWGVYFDGETGRHVAARQEFPSSACRFDTTGFAVQVGSATLQPGRAQGAVAQSGRHVDWDLDFEGGAPPLLLLPSRLYDAHFPAAKSLVSLPLARFSGTLSVNGRPLDVTGWIGSQNHNWGTRHTDLYAWGQVAGFDSDPDSFLEVATARLRIGPAWTPPMTLLVLRHRQKEYTMNGLLRSLRAHGRFSYFEWEFRSRSRDAQIQGVIAARREDFVGLGYHNPPGGLKHCLNSKIARCRLELRDHASDATEVLETRRRAAFEILTDERDHGVAISA